MRTWTAETTVAGRPEDVLAILTDPEAVVGGRLIAHATDALTGTRPPGALSDAVSRIAREVELCTA